MKPVDAFVKRLFDLLASSFGLIFLLPLAILIGLLIKVTSSGPIFFIQERIGRDGEKFKCVKFRTMTSGGANLGTITTALDRRITPLGRLLRTWKLDEFPQLWNVVVGKMSLVGPRPDVPGYADKLDDADRVILELKPGITGPASIFFRYEEEILAEVENPQLYNDEIIWPVKVLLNRRYLEQYAMLKDFGLVLITIVPALQRIFPLLPPSPRTRDGVESALKKPPFTHQ